MIKLMPNPPVSHEIKLGIKPTPHKDPYDYAIKRVIHTVKGNREEVKQGWNNLAKEDKKREG